MKAKWAFKKRKGKEFKARQGQVKLAQVDLSNLSDQGKVFLDALAKVGGAADAAPYLKRSVKLSELGRRTDETLAAYTKEAQELYETFKPMESIEENLMEEALTE